MVCNLKLPVGIENFEEIRKNEFYYIDKTAIDGNWRKGDIVHASTSLWKDLKYEHVARFF